MTGLAIALALATLLATATFAAGGPPAHGRVDLASDAAFRIDGSAEDERAGTKVDSAGDVNGDGTPDVIVGTDFTPVAYVVFGGGSGSLDLASPGTSGFRIEGPPYSNLSVSGAGDVNGDGRDDVIVGDYDSNLAWVVFGEVGTTAVDLEALGSQGFRIEGALGDALGSRVDDAGDVNGDGLADVVISAFGASRNDRIFSGSAYVVFGKQDTEPVDLASLGDWGYRIDGAAARDFSHTVSGAGDFNGDGRPDVLLGAPRLFRPASVYVVFGRSAGGVVDLADPGTAVRIDYAKEDPAGGRALDGAGDVNGDGLADVVLGATARSGPGLSGHVVFGRRSTAPIALASLGSGGFTIGGGPASGESPPVAGAGDVNGDGLADVVLGMQYADGTRERYAGRSFVVFGKSSTATVNLGSLDRDGLQIDGAATLDLAGSAVAGAGDVDGDRRGDILIGAPGANNNGRRDSGSVYVVRGRRCCPGGAAPGRTGPPARVRSLLDAPNATITGGGIGNWAGPAGDVNGDGLDDVVLNSYDRQQGTYAAYVVFGTASRSGIGLPGLGARGFRIDVPAGELIQDAQGAGDVNGDGLDDVIVGAPKRYPVRGGSAYVVFGKRATDTVDTGALGQGGFRISGAGEDFRIPVAGAGDVNGDRRADVIVGTPGAGNNGRVSSGSAYVVFGKTSSAEVALATLGAGGFRIDGVQMNSRAGSFVAGPGDINGDARADVLVTAGRDPGDEFGSGTTYVVFGKDSSAPVDLAALGGGGFPIQGPRLYDDSDRSMAAAGDVNGDGLADVVVAYPYALTLEREGAGGTYVVYGKSSTTSVHLAALGSAGVQILGDSHVGQVWRVAGGGDFDRDGYGDLILGVPDAYRDRQNTGAAYLVYGRRSRATIDLAALGRGGVRYEGSGDESAGSAVAGAGDFDGDRRADVIVGAEHAGGPPAYPGAAYIVFGHSGR